MRRPHASPHGALQRARGLLPGIALLAAGAAACGDAGGTDAPRDPGEPAAADPAGVRVETPRTVETRDGLYQLTWEPVGGFVPVNEHFEVDVRVETAEEPARPVEGAEVVLSADMPAHGHGMIREPRSEEVGGGAYRVKGVLLHMGGRWTLSLSVVVDGVASSADDELTL